MKKWHRHRLRRQSVVSGHSSRALSTTSYYMGRDRASLPLGIPLGDTMSKEVNVSSPTNSPVNNNNNGRIFRKAASMPKMPTDTCSSPSYPITRVESSSRVTFSCDDTSIDNNPDLIPIFPERSSSNPNNSSVFNEVHEIPKIDETNSLLPETVKNDNKDTYHGTDNKKSRFKIVNFFMDMRVLKSKETGGGDPWLSTPPQTQCVHALPPVLDVEEEASETSAR